MNILVIGSGGREHALAWALARSPGVRQVYVAPGNAGTTWAANPAATGWQPRAAAANVPIEADNIPALLAFAQANHISLTVIGPEAALALGIADHFQAAGLCVFGPTQAAAQLESSKTFAKNFMVQIGIPTAAYGGFADFQTARDYVRQLGRPVVVKADGLAAGKGVMVCDSTDEAETALNRIMITREFGDAGRQVIVEERLSGSEVSALAFSDGKTVRMMPFARDHKRIFDGDHGPNTGGMGAYAPVPDVDEGLHDQILATVLQPAVAAIAERGTPYVGVLYAGLMLTTDGPKVLEFNCRFGDPETQAILPLLDSDLAQIMIACAEGELDKVPIHWRPGVCATIVLAAPGYPGSYPKGAVISGLEDSPDDTMIFHAGTARKAGQIVTAGGRVLAVSAYGETQPAALQHAYSRIESVHFDGQHYRRDIGQTVLQQEAIP